MTRIFDLIRSLFKISFFEKKMRVLINEREPNSFLSKLVPNNYSYPIGSVRYFDYKGIHLKLDIHDCLSHYLYFGFKDTSHNKLMSLIKKDDIIIDIGTNYGTTILQFAKIIGENGKAYGFEPDPTNFTICQENIKLNSFSNIKVENVGLGSKEENVLLVVESETNRGMNRIKTKVDGKEAHQIKIIRFDDWITTKGVSKINLIKIDVEGFEMEVLKGAEKSLTQFHPILFIELDDNNLKQQNTSAKELVQFLKKMNYLINHSESGIPISENDVFFNCHYDIVCT